jgi:nitrogen regulatory protein PII
MKLVIITAIKEFEKDVKLQLKQAKVISFSYRDVTGYRDSTEDALESNWFSSEMNQTRSMVFYAFVKKEHVDLLFDLINKFNKEQKTLSHIHVASLNIERTN